MSKQYIESDTDIMIVDDEQISLDVIGYLLKDEGFKVVTSRSGDDCYDMAEKSVPDLILLDINMPGTNGIETCRKLKKNSSTCNIPVIFMTANNEDVVLEKAFESGCTDYICKPVSRVELLARIKSALNNKIMKEKLLEDEKFKSIVELAGGICHELNQPLHAIMGYADLLIMDCPENSKIFRQVKTISEQAERMGKITQQLMNLTRNKTKKYIGNTSIIDLEKSSGEDEVNQREDNG